MNTINHLFKTYFKSNSIRVNYIISLSAFVFLLTGCEQVKEKDGASTKPSVPITALQSGSATTFVDYPAAVRGIADIEIRPQVSGYIKNVLVTEGAYVSAGQTLFQIDPQPFKEALNNAKANLNAAEAAILNARLEVEKLTPLVQNNVVSDFQLKTAQTAYKIAQANAQQARAGVATAKINLGYTDVKAPISGYLGLIHKKQGSLVSASDQTALTQISDISEIQVYFSLSEKDFALFNSKYSIKKSSERSKNLPEVDLILSDNSVYPQKGKIDMVNGQFDKHTGSITLRASFPNPDGNLRSGSTGKLRLGLNYDSALQVPQSATMEIQDKIFVFLVEKNNKVTKTPITVVGKSGNNYLVKHGLHTGDQIVLSGLDRLQEGQAISPQRSIAVAQLTNKN